jgi:hypothetical protein
LQKIKLLRNTGTYTWDYCVIEPYKTTQIPAATFVIAKLFSLSFRTGKGSSNSQFIFMPVSKKWDFSGNTN